NGRRAKSEEAGDRPPLLLSPGEGRRIPPLEAREADGAECAGDALRHLGGRHARVLEPEDHLLRHVGREELRLEVLEDHADRPRELAYPAIAHRDAEELDLARHLAGKEARHDAGETAGESRLASAGGPHDHGKRTKRELQVRIADGRPRRTRIRAGEAAHHDGGRAHRSARPAPATPRNGTRPKPTSQAPLAVRHGTQGGRQRPLATSSPALKAATVPTTTHVTPSMARHAGRRARGPSTSR